MHTALKHFLVGIYLLFGLPGTAQPVALWDLEALYRAPAYRKSNLDTVAAVYYQGLPYRGKATQVFAYYATPGTLSGHRAKDVRLPAVVLIHGGGGLLSRSGQAVRNFSICLPWIRSSSTRGSQWPHLQIHGRER